MTLGQRINELRRAKGTTHTQLAELAGISRSYVTRLRPLSGGASKEQKRSVAHWRLLALILGFLGWVTLAYALAVLLTHDGAVVMVDSLGPWEPWLDVAAVAVALSVTGAALVWEDRTSRKSNLDVRRLGYDPDRNPTPTRTPTPSRS